MNLEERVVAAEVASRRADGPGVIEVQSQRRSDVAGQGLGPGTQWRGRPVRPGSRGVRRPGADQDARLGVDLDVPELARLPQAAHSSGSRSTPSPMSYVLYISP